MTWNNRVTPIALFLFLLAIGTALPAYAERRDLEVGLKIPSANELGAYTGAAGFSIGEVTDATFSESPSHVGVGPQAIYEIVTVGTRAEAIRKGVTEAFGQAGLLKTTPAPSMYTVDITLRRVHEQTHMTFSRFRLRSEIFLEFTLKKNGISEGRVLASGNAQTYAQVATKAKYTEVFQLAFNDAIYKLFNSKTLARIAGEGWKPVPAPAESGKYDATRIRKDEFYGPTDSIQEEASKASKAVQAAGSFSAVSLPDFELTAVTGKTNSAVADVAFARALVPALVQEHLNAFFPGAFTTIERPVAGAAKQGLLVGGKLDDFQVGNYYLRSLVGFGAGKDKLEGEIFFRDAATGNTLYSFKAVSSNWGAGWQTKRGTIRDMADQLARDIAYFLVQTAAPNYQPPQDLEILFDDTRYPMKQRKS